MSPLPFQGNYIDSNGYIRNLDGGSGNDLPLAAFSGFFYDSDGVIRNISDMSLVSGVGSKGDNGWSPVIANILDGERVAQQIIDWVGGTGKKPEVGKYIGETGLVQDIADAVDIRGTPGGIDDSEEIKITITSI